jgi:hypothetical protein
MRIGGFELSEPVPELNSPHAVAVLRPWIDAGEVGTMILERLEANLGARELGKLATPGNHYDFTRYRPTVRWIDDVRELTLPNTNLLYAKVADNNDFIFIHLLEPHAFGELYCESVFEILKHFKAQRYILIGSMYDMVPHTRPLLISGNLPNQAPARVLSQFSIQQGRYSGPTTICNLISQEAQKAGMETMTLLAHLPQYTEVEEDYNGVVAISRVLDYLYGIPVDDVDKIKAERQLKKLDAAVARSKKLRAIVTELEGYYDNQADNQQKPTPKLSGEVEQFLKQMEKKFGAG